MYKLMIADDESIECRALEHKIRYMTTEIEILPSVYDGISLIKSIEKYRPHIVIVDINMPGLSGLEVIELLKMKNISSKIIVNTAYSDFAYVQKALKMGASDYLLKPHNNEELTEAIQKVVRELDLEYKGKNEWEKSKAAADTLYQVAGEKWMLSLMLEEPDEKCYEVLCSSIPKISQGGGFVVWQIRQSSKQPYLKMKEIAGHILADMQKYCHCIGLEHKDRYYMFVITESQEQYEGMEEAVRHICEILGRKKIFVSAGISSYKKEKKQFSAGMKEAKLALQSREGAGVSCFSYTSKLQPIPSFFAGKLEKSAELLCEGRQEECIQLLKETVEKKWSSCEAEDALKVQAIDYMLMLEERLKRLTGKEELERPIPWSRICEAADAETISESLEQWIIENGLHYFRKRDAENLYVEKAVLYIHEHYSQDISLERVAEAIGISPFYLSRLLKQEKNQTFVEILTEVRIHRAIRLMKEEKLPMKEICQSIGYSNMTYFYKVFKKATGFTVGTVKKYLT